MIDTMPARLSRAITAPGRTGADLDEMKKLLAAEPDLIDQIDPWGKRPLANAASSRNVEAVKLLLAAGAAVNASTKDGAALHFATYRNVPGKAVDVVKALIAAGADVNARNDEGRTPIHKIVEGRTKTELEIVKLMIAAGADVNAADEGGLAVLMIASRDSSPDIVQALIDAGADVNVVSSGGSPLSLAAEWNRADTAAVLLDNGADPGFRFPADFGDAGLAGKTALDVARARKAKKVVTLLQSAGSGSARGKSSVAAPPAVAESWKKIGAWLAAHNKELHAALHPPAEDADLAELERVIGRKLPEDFKAAWKIHNGNADVEASLLPPMEASDDPHGNSQTPGGYYLMPAAEIVQEWRGWKSLADGGEFADAPGAPDRGIQDSWWHSGWVPFASNGGGDSLCLDLAPTAEGAVGQVITMSHESPERQLLAGSFAQWLADLARMMGKGRGE